MTSNAANMTLEERIVQTLKEDNLMKLVGDEDAILALVNRALREALFDDRVETVGSGYNERREKHPSAVVAAARSAADKAASEAADRLMAEALERPDVKAAIMAVIPSLLVHAFVEKARGVWATQTQESVAQAEMRIREAMAGM